MKEFLGSIEIRTYGALDQTLASVFYAVTTKDIIS
jgi:hypothetical protein